MGWDQVDWQPMDQTWLGPEYNKEDFQGRYKLLWDEKQLYILAEIIDDTLIDIYPDGLIQYWDDDCLEIFIDEDASGGDHQYNNNAFAYHISLDNKIVDIGPDSIAHYYDHIKCVRKTTGNKSIWELALQLYKDDYKIGQNNQLVILTNLKKIGFAIAYCDNDNSKERENFIGNTYVKVPDKNRGWIDAGVFETLTLIK